MLTHHLRQFHVIGTDASVPARDLLRKYLQQEMINCAGLYAVVR